MFSQPMLITIIVLIVALLIASPMKIGAYRNRPDRRRQPEDVMPVIQPLLDYIANATDVNTLELTFDKELILVPDAAALQAAMNVLGVETQTLLTVQAVELSEDHTVLIVTITEDMTETVAVYFTQNQIAITPSNGGEVAEYPHLVTA